MEILKTTIFAIVLARRLTYYALSKFSTNTEINRFPCFFISHRQTADQETRTQKAIFAPSVRFRRLLRFTRTL